MNEAACTCCACQYYQQIQLSPLGCVLLTVGLIICFGLMAYNLSKAAEEEAKLFAPAV